MTCKFDGCTKPVHGHGWCITHYTRWRRDQPLTGPRGYIPADRVRPFLNRLREFRQLHQIAETIGCSERALSRLARPDSRTVHNRIAEAIIREAGGDPDGMYEERVGEVSWPEVAEYALTDEGQEFIEQCRTLRTEEP